MSLIVWNHPEGKEIYSLDEFIELFDLNDISSQGPRFDLKKLDWVNGQWVRGMLDIVLAERIVAYSKHSKDEILRVLPLVKDRLNLLSEFDNLVEIFFAENLVEISGVDELRANLLGKHKDKELSKRMLQRALEELEHVESWNHEVLEKLMRGVLEEEGWKIGEFFMALRVGVTGRTATPPLFETMQALGKDLSLNRMREALALLD
jgi:glutamyl-tRNA synthetase